MARYIDAEDLMRRMYNRAFETDGDTMWQSGCWVRYRAIEAVVKETPAADVAPRWIPVTDGLPEEEGQYLVSCGTDYGIEVGRLYIDEDGERYFGCDWNDPDDIEAWMPLPEPYKRGEWKNERT